MLNQAFDLQNFRQKQWETLLQLTGSQCLPLQEIQNIILTLDPIESFWAYPGPEVLYKIKTYLTSESEGLLKQLIHNTALSILSQNYRFTPFIPFSSPLQKLDKPLYEEKNTTSAKPYFEVLIVHPSRNYEAFYRESLNNFVTEKDEFLYGIAFVEYATDAFMAAMANPSIQACVLVPGFSVQNPASPYTTQLPLSEQSPVLQLSQLLRQKRPQLDLYLISETQPETLPLALREAFDRILFYHPFQDLHYALLNGIRDRFSTPFFHALQAYSKKSICSFHALPVSRGQSLQKSPWVQDMLAFYGHNIFLAETSSTQGGLDSLLAPKGAIKQAHDKAAETFGSHRSFFVTNGTSTANKIVIQSILKPEDIVLLSSDCHKSIPYAIVMAGAWPIFLETYPLKHFDLYGAVHLTLILNILKELKAKNQLDRVKQISLTHSTFDGLLYPVEHFMREILKIKPDLVFHWDEAWFAFGHFNPLYEGRSAMKAAKQLEKEGFSPKVYATQSTHKTLTAFRQGSMIHIFDAHFQEDIFIEAYRMHTSTSPNYQILASLDIGRRQMALEGYERTQEMIYWANQLRQSIHMSKALSPYFQILETQDLVPNFKKTTPIDASTTFIVDPTRITLDIRNTGMDGGNFRDLLINRYHIQVNKTSLFTVLFIVNLGVNQDRVRYLIQVLHDIAERLELEKKPDQITVQPDFTLPQKRSFHPAFSPFSLKHCEISDLRAPFYAAYNPHNITFISIDTQLIKDILNDKKLYSAAFVTPYPPGFPLLVPGQRITYDILMYLQKLRTKEIHGYRPSEGLKVFESSFLEGRSWQH